MVRATSGTINTQRENQADEPLDIRNTQLYPSFSLSNVRLTARDFNAETGIVKVGRFEFVKLDTFKVFMKNRKEVLNQTTDAQIISFIKGLDKNVATEEIRDDLLEEVAEALYSYLENTNKLGGFSSFDVDETDFDDLKAKFIASIPTDIVSEPTSESTTGANVEVSSQAFDVAEYERTNQRVKVVETTDEGYVIFTETATGGTYEFKQYENQNLPATHVVKDRIIRHFTKSRGSQEPLLALPTTTNAPVNVVSPALGDGLEYDFGTSTLTLTHDSSRGVIDLFNIYLVSMARSGVYMPRNMTL
jgi:hypothetical protein